MQLPFRALPELVLSFDYIEDNNYFYYLTDHLGNNRAVATATASIVQRTQYYPFGLPFADAQGRDLQPYTYNGKQNVLIKREQSQTQV